MAYFFAPSGSRITPNIDVSHINIIETSRVCWRETINTGTSLTIETRVSNDYGLSWSDWAEVTNWGTIPDLENDTDFIQCKQTLFTNASRDQTPVLEKLTLIINNNFFAHVSDGGGEIRITESDAVTQVAREIVSCDPVDFTGEVYFDCGTLPSDMPKDFYVYYGSSGGEYAQDYAETHTYGAQNVWTTKYLMVQHLNESTGSNAYDSTSNDNDGTRTGMAYHDFATRDEDPDDSTYVYEGIPGNDGGTNYWDGSDSYIDIPASDTILAPDYITVSVWVNFSRLRDYDTIIGKGWTGEGYSLRNFENNTIIWSIYDPGDGGSWLEVTSNPVIETSEWHYIKGTFDGNVSAIYVDGVLQDTKPANFARVKKDANIGLGAEPSDSYNREIQGYLDEVRIMNSAETSGFIESEYNNFQRPSIFWRVSDEETYTTSPTGISDTIIFTDFCTVVTSAEMSPSASELIIFTDSAIASAIGAAPGGDLGWIIDNVTVKYKINNRYVSLLSKVSNINKYNV